MECERITWSSCFSQMAGFKYKIKVFSQTVFTVLLLNTYGMYYNHSILQRGECRERIKCCWKNWLAEWRRVGCKWLRKTKLLQRGFAKLKNSKKRDNYGSFPSLTRKKYGKSSQNTPTPVLKCCGSIPRVCCEYTLVKVVSQYGVSVLLMSVMRFQKRTLDRVVGEVTYIQVFFWFVNFAKI